MDFRQQEMPLNKDCIESIKYFKYLLYNQFNGVE